MKFTPPSSQESDDRRRHWEWLLLLLALLMSFGCVFGSTRLALSFWPDLLAPASLLPGRQADYTGGPTGIRFAVLDPAVGALAATDLAWLHITPTGDTGDDTSGTISLLPATPTPTVKPGPPPTLPEKTSTATPEPIPTTAPTSTNTPPPTPVDTPTLVPPTATPPPTNTLPPVLPTPTLVPLPTDAPVPTPTPTPDNSHNDNGSSPGNNPPVAVRDKAITDEDTAVTIAVLTNDSDSDGTLLPGTVTITNGPASGTTSVDPATGEISYTPTLDFNGLDSFTYRVCDDGGACDPAKVKITVKPVNDPPLAAADTAFTAEDTWEDIDVRANDSDVDGDPLTVILVSPASNGTATTDGSIVTYSPNGNFNGTDVLTYTVSDGSLADTAMVTITVVAINDPPVAVADAYSTTMSTTLTVSAAAGVLSNDLDIDTGDSLTAIKVTDPVSGTLTLNGDGSFIYTPNGGFSGTDIFTYRAADTIMAPSNVTTVTITVS